MAFACWETFLVIDLMALSRSESFPVTDLISPSSLEIFDRTNSSVANQGCADLNAAASGLLNPSSIKRSSISCRFSRVMVAFLPFIARHTWARTP